MVIHFGNNNYKRRYSTCGARTLPSDSVSVEKVNCIHCIETLIKRAYKNYPSKKTPKWVERLKSLKALND